MNSKLDIVNNLIVKISKGEINALDDLFEEVGGLLFAMAKKYLIDKTLAEDLVSEIFVRLSRSSKKFDAKKNGLNWLFKSIHNDAIKWNRKNNPYAYKNIDEHKELADLLSIDDKIDKIILKDALKNLSKLENKILYYKFWEGLTVRDIAKIIKKPRSTTQDIINNALENLCEILK